MKKKTLIKYTLAKNIVIHKITIFKAPILVRLAVRNSVFGGACICL